MSRTADRVHTAAADIARLEATALQLQQDQHVRVLLDDGSQLDGIVVATPNVQQFYDPRGEEGANAVLRLEAMAPAVGTTSLWLDRITAVTHLPNPSPPEASTRSRPPDPNAPTA